MKIIINILLYLIFCEFVLIGINAALTGLDTCPTMQYKKALQQGLTWQEFIEKK